MNKANAGLEGLALIEGTGRPRLVPIVADEKGNYPKRVTVDGEKLLYRNASHDLETMASLHGKAVARWEASEGKKSKAEDERKAKLAELLKS